MASLTPAQRAGKGVNRVGSLEVGKQADMLVLTDKLEVRASFFPGKKMIPYGRVIPPQITGFRQGRSGLHSKE